VGVIAASATFAVIEPRPRPSHSDHRGQGGRLAQGSWVLPREAANNAAATALRPRPDTDTDTTEATEATEATQDYRPNLS
jgi:hypothetical protein